MMLLAMDVKDHWETIYRTKAANEVSWYQREAAVSLALIRQVASGNAAILDIGGGASTLVDSLLSHGYNDVTVLDIAANALPNAKARLGADAARARWIVGDALALDLPHHSVDVWHDRAVFHFLMLPAERRRY